MTASRRTGQSGTLAGHDAVFKAERAIAGDNEEGKEESVEGKEESVEGKEESVEGKEESVEGKEESVEGKRGRECVEWLLGCKDLGGLERGVRGGDVVEGDADGDVAS
jgi:hypothetical protein